jgi:hypothetical protein
MISLWGRRLTTAAFVAGFLVACGGSKFVLDDGGGADSGGGGDDAGAGDDATSVDDATGGDDATGADDSSVSDGGIVRDAGRVDAGTDARPNDSGHADSGDGSGGHGDASSGDASSGDASSGDAASGDAGRGDAAVDSGGGMDAGSDAPMCTGNGLCDSTHPCPSDGARVTCCMSILSTQSCGSCSASGICPL